MIHTKENVVAMNTTVVVTAWTLSPWSVEWQENEWVSLQLRVYIQNHNLWQVDRLLTQNEVVWL